MLTPPHRLRRPRALAALLVAPLALQAPRAVAQAESGAGARALFEEGRRLIKEGDYADACPKLEAAAKIQASPGVLLNLGDCYEHTNRSASAWAEFADAAAEAARAGRPDQEAEAERRRQLLGPKLARIVVRVSAETPGLGVQRDGVPVDRSAWGSALPVDPGDHVVAAGAAGYASWSASVRIDAPGDVVVEVPSLTAIAPKAVLPAVHSEQPESPPPPIFWTTPRVAGAGIVGAGAIALGVAGALGLAARGKQNQAEGETSSARVDDSTGAVLEGNVATGFVIGGAAIVVAGIVLWIAAPALRPQGKTSDVHTIFEGTF
jgi:hypothetical protein